jgi:hypothetical protein
MVGKGIAIEIILGVRCNLSLLYTQAVLQVAQGLEQGMRPDALSNPPSGRGKQQVSRPGHHVTEVIPAGSFPIGSQAILKVTLLRFS